MYVKKRLLTALSHFEEIFQGGAGGVGKMHALQKFSRLKMAIVVQLGLKMNSGTMY